MDEMQEAIKEFLVESHENLEQLDTDFVMLEKDPGDVQTLGSIFRTMHTLKGSAGLLGYEKLQALAHAGESLLSRLRDRVLNLTPEMTTTLLEVVDAVRQMLRLVESAGNDGDLEHAELIDALGRLRGLQSAVPATASTGTAASAQSRSPAATAFIGTDAVPLSDDSSELDIEVDLTVLRGDATDSKPVVSAELPAARKTIPTPLADTSKKAVAAQPSPPAPTTPAAAVIKSSTQPGGPASVAAGGVQPARRETKKRLPATATFQPGILPTEPQAESSKAGQSAITPSVAAQTSVVSVADSTIRIDVGLLDKLMTLVSELVLSRNQILQLSSVLSHPGLVNTTRQLNLITSELQEQVMKTRMQPIGNILGKFPRMVRDMAMACGKQVNLELEGSDTELDKSIIEAVRDPLTHLVRNSVDHGIETPDRRRTAGKPIEGRLFLRAFHEGGQVNIEISDDGAGIDPQRIKRKAVERELITPEDAELMSDQSVLNLIFLPGLSTSDRVTNYSGRGVGMDVVKTNIEKIGGSIDVVSRLGEGTSVKMRIPLTLAIIRALVITSAGDRFAIPQVNMIELVRLDGDQARARVERLHDVPVFRYRGKLLPLVFLNRVLGTESAPATSVPVDAATHSTALNIIVLQADDRQFGLVVDRVRDTQEIVVKPLAKQLKGIACFAGATIMGDGQVALILDVLGLAQKAGILAKARELALAESKTAPVTSDDDRQSFLLVRGDAGPMAIPLSAVARIEKLDRRSVESVGGQRVVQYRGEILPLIDIAEVLAGNSRGDSAHDAGPARAAASDGWVQVVVYSERGRSVGLIVDRILDILEQTVAVRGRPGREHVLFTAVMQNQVTEVLNVEDLIRAADPTFFNAAVATAGVGASV